MTPTLLINNVYAGEVPEGAENFRVMKFSQPETLSYDYSIVKGDRCTSGLIAMIDLPPGSWQLIGTVREMTEDVAKGIVGSSEWYFPARHTRYIDYNHPYDRENKQRWSEGFVTAKESLLSLVASKGLDTNKNWVLVRKG
jgi:hypothetical protein